MTAVALVARTCLALALASFLPVLLVQWADGASLAELADLYTGSGAREDAARDAAMDELRRAVEAQAGELERFKDLSEKTTVPRERFNKLKEKALQVSADLVRVRTEVEKYRGDAKAAAARGSSVRGESTRAVAKLNATYAGLFRKAKQQMEQLKQGLKQRDATNEKLEQQLAAFANEQKQADQQSAAGRKDLEAALQKARADLAAAQEEVRFLKERPPPSPSKAEALELEEQPDHAASDQEVCLQRLRELAAQAKAAEERSKGAEDALKAAKAKLAESARENDRLQKQLAKAQADAQAQAQAPPPQQQAQAQAQAGRGDEFADLGFGAASQPPPTQQHQVQPVQQQPRQGYAQTAYQSTGAQGYPGAVSTFGAQPVAGTYSGNNFGGAQQQQQQQQQQQTGNYGALPQQQQQQQMGGFGGPPGGYAQQAPLQYISPNAAQVYGSGGQQPARNNFDPCAGARKFEFNSDRPGPSFRSEQVQSARRCRELCLKDFQCQAWVYVKAQAMCYLKAGQSGPAADSCCVSGPKC